MYFDPGTGSMLIQILLGAIPVIGAFLIGLRKKIFRKKGTELKAEEEQTASPEAAAATKETGDGFEDIDDD